LRGAPRGRPAATPQAFRGPSRGHPAHIAMFRVKLFACFRCARSAFACGAFLKRSAATRASPHAPDQKETARTSVRNWRATPCRGGGPRITLPCAPSRTAWIRNKVLRTRLWTQMARDVHWLTQFPSAAPPGTLPGPGPLRSKGRPLESKYSRRKSHFKICRLGAPRGPPIFRLPFGST